ncbi:polymorphic toxin-type HINT domain-containing protein [Paenibacillus sp. ACRRX]|uniref:polymorphic toxin-type HINT domain-containing protein n=1 Tax=Paenibacillus sp. ACRRX TaxID=2918206 RepID=UPI0031BB0A74
MWGLPLGSKETVLNIFGYAGEYWDSVSDLQYLRARWYDPSIARFISEDKNQGKIEEPDTLNRYTYVENNPLNGVDPTGEHRLECAFQCFSAGTKIQTDEGLKVIEDIQVGDKVLAKSEETGETAYKAVEETFNRTADEVYVIEVKQEKITTTEEHPFWIEGKGWVEAGDLSVGDKLVDRDGQEYPIESITVRTEPTKVYNFRVQGYHNYFVTDLRIWTHNCGGGDSAGQEQDLLHPAPFIAVLEV